MRFKRVWAAVAASALVAACGGGGDGDQTPRVAYGKMVSFGDSLSDVGSYKVSAVAALGGGQYTVNSPTVSNWTQLLAAQAGVARPCAAQTGLLSEIEGVPAVPVADVTGCFGYAQGGARVTNPVGPENPALPGNQLGQMTVPVASQIARHLSVAGGNFASNDLVTVMAGGNDVFMNLAAVGAGAASPEQAVIAMATAGGELAALVRAQILAKGGPRTVVVNLPDVSQTPFAVSQGAPTAGLISQMVVAFNTALREGLAPAGEAVLLVDAYTQGRDQTANPGQYALTNVTGMACNLAAMSIPSSLTCTAANLVAGQDTSHWLYADSVHPTPYGYNLLARFVAAQMARRGWL